jgi:hypothetical protein
MAYEVELAQLHAAVGSGALKVESIVNGVKKSVTYANFDELWQRIAYLESLQADAAGRRVGPRVSVATFSRGR